MRHLAHSTPRSVGRRRVWLLGLGALLVLPTAGCVSGSKIRADAEVVKRDIAKARDSGAYRCAPRDLAMAETHTRFCEDELDAGNWVRAEEHVQVALVAVRRALEESKECAPKKVVVAPKVTIQKTDIDGDGIFDVDDKCPSDPEDKDGFQDKDGCPDLDNDQDGVPDGDDRCPNDPGPTTNLGCPTQDRDGDGFFDDIDKCPDEPEDKDGFQDEDGCPDLDNDGDGILDGEDKCPNEAGPADSPQGKGCPRKFSLIKINRDKQQIEIKQKVHFLSGKWKILPDSFGLLNQVVQALQDFPKMRVSIEGHTDDVGPDAFNQKLSENRAGAVRDYLVQKGIDAERLQAVGFGESHAIASNRTARGREANRRVEFKIVEEKAAESP